MKKEVDFEELMKDLESYEERMPFVYKSKCNMTRMFHFEDNSQFTITKKNIYSLLDEILVNNPHYKLSWITTDDMMEIVEKAFRIGCPNITYEEAEMIIVAELETYNSRKWTFKPGLPYCPYWNWTKEQYDNYGQMMLEIELRRLVRM